MLVSFPSAFIFFSSYDLAKKHGYAHMIAGAFGEFMTNLFKNPFEVVKN